MSSAIISEVRDFIVKDQIFKDAGALSLDHHSDTTNLTAFAEFADVGSRLTRQIFIKGIHSLAARHPYLRTAFIIDGCAVKQLLLKEVQVPISFYKDSGHPEQWREIIKSDLPKRFTKSDEPSWRVSIVEGEKKGQIFLTFHHAISDGLSAASAMNQLFEILAQYIEGKEVEIIEIDPTQPSLDCFYSPEKNLSAGMGQRKLVPRPQNYTPCYTDFVRKALDKNLTSQIEQFSKNNRELVTVHSVIYAALLKAVVEVKKPLSKEFSTLSIYSIRKELQAGNAMRPLFTGLICPADARLPFFELAKQIKANLHDKIQQKEYQFHLQIVAERHLQSPTPADLLSESKLPPNMINLSNIGKLDFTGDYGAIQMITLDAAAGCTPYFDYSFLSGGVSFSLAVRTFRGQIRFVANFPRSISEQGDGKNVEDHKKILNLIEAFLETQTATKKSLPSKL